MRSKLRNVTSAAASLLLLVSVTANAAPETAAAVALRDVTVLDMRSENLQRDVTVLVRGKRIAAVGKELNIPQDANGR
jgi:imidazolonepropionase-like amidohydrolase